MDAGRPDFFGFVNGNHRIGQNFYRLLVLLNLSLDQQGAVFNQDERVILGFEFIRQYRKGLEIALLLAAVDGPSGAAVVAQTVRTS